MVMAVVLFGVSINLGNLVMNVALVMGHVGSMAESS